MTGNLRGFIEFVAILVFTVLYVVSIVLYNHLVVVVVTKDVYSV